MSTHPTHTRQQMLRSVLLLTTLGATIATAQIEVEDLEVEESPIAFEVEQAYAEAVALFDTTDQEQSLPLFGSVIDSLSPLALAEDPQVLEMLREALLFRIRGRFNFGNRDGAIEDMAQLVELQPALQLDRAAVSARLADLYDEVRNERVGFLALQIEPSDAQIVLFGETLPWQAEPYALLAGTYTAEIRRPGYQPASLAFDIAANETFEESLALDRTSALVALRTRPTDARILIDGVEVGRTAGQADAGYVPLGEAARYPGPQFSEELEIDGVQIGSHVLEILKAGFRPFRTTLEVTGMDDYRFEPVLLNAEEGVLELRSLPSDAELWLNDESNRSRPDADGTLRLTLAPGNYRVTVARGASGRFEGTVDVLDRSSISLEIKLRPALTLLGILGEDEVAAQSLRDTLGDAFRRADNWIVLDRSTDAERGLRDAGLDAPLLRTAAQGAGGAIDWSEVQNWADESYPGSAHVIGVLTDDLIAAEADLWLLPAAPGPARPDRRRVDLTDPLAIPELASRFATEFEPVRATFGLTLVDSELAAGPLVAAVASGSSAERAGLRPGVTILSIDGVELAEAAQARGLFEKASLDQSFSVMTDAASAAIELKPDRSWTVLDPSDESIIFPAIAANLQAELERSSEWPRWLLQLNRAALLLRAGDAEGTIRTLRRIDIASVPETDAGLGRASVDYLLGLALTQAGPRYLENARDAFAKAAQSRGQRLHHNDGPLLATRAQARLERLGGAP